MDNKFDETLWKELHWMRCLNCFISAKYDRRLIIFCCSHQCCYNCFKKAQVNPNGGVCCPLCQQATKFAPIFSHSLTERARTLLQPFQFDQLIPKLQYQRRQRTLISSQLIAVTNKTKQVCQQIVPQHQKLSKLNEKMAQDVDNAQKRLFRGFSCGECNKVLAMPIQRCKETNIGKIIYERLASSGRTSSPCDSIHRHNRL